ncbi:hypothetical protein PVAP13_6NG016322 [Panicum virgatum]|uniref:Uncharacterized protein n=1 Tax=Panicum virgatum TaxID=38727 RepID=A0A8T0QT09_PANVG|nr:hypothetical protein PVAP13_6NG016322 [Panicum virgatum]
MPVHWEEDFETDTFPEGSLQHTLWIMLGAVGFTSRPLYTTYRAVWGTDTTEYYAKLVILGRSLENGRPPEPDREFRGYGSSGPMSLREAAYEAIIHFRHELPETSTHFFYYPERADPNPDTNHNNIYRLPTPERRPTLRYLAMIVRSLDMHLNRLRRDYSLARRRRLARFEVATRSLSAMGFFQG